MADSEREKLFQEVWQEPMTTVAKRYGVSDNGLRKRCIKLQIPLPPAGYWAKLQAGKPVPPRPELPPWKYHYYQEAARPNRLIYYIDVDELTREQLEALEPMDLLTPESKERFVEWCNDIHVPRTLLDYETLINDYLKEVDYRKARDEEHRFRDTIWHYRFRTSKIAYRNNKAVLPITTSKRLNNRALRIANTIINMVKELDSKVEVKQGETDNAVFLLSDQEFSFQINERMIKRRSLLAAQPDKAVNEFRPLYEKVFSGILQIKFSQRSRYSEKDKPVREFVFEDTPEGKIEVQLGEMFQAVIRAANEAVIARIITRRENQAIAEEQRRLRLIEEEKRRALQQAEEHKRRKKQVSENIEQRMEGWYKAQKLRKFAWELEEYAGGIGDEGTKELLFTYIALVNEKAEKCDPVADIAKEVKTMVGPTRPDDVGMSTDELDN
jgi:hypothetical protein